MNTRFDFDMAPTKTIAAGSLILSIFFAYVNDTRERAFLLGSFAALFFGQLFIYAAYAVLIYPFYVSPLRHIPTAPGGHWLLGHGMKIVKEVNGNPSREWIRTVPNDGILRYFWFFNIERVLVTSPQAMAEVLVTKNYTFPKPAAVRANIGRALGFGILLAEGDEHKLQRRNLMPAFAFRHVKDLYPTFWRKTREVVQAMTQAAGSNGVLETEVYGWSSRVTLDIIGLAGMGKDFGAIQDENNHLVQLYNQLFKPTRGAQILALLESLVGVRVVGLLPVRRTDHIAEASKRIREVCLGLIAEKRAKMEGSGGEKHRGEDVDILGVAMESGLFSDAGLVDQMMTFLAAGHETTASAMIWAIYLLSKHKDMQDKLRQEIRENLPSVDDAETAVSSIDVDKMPFLNAVTSEVLRYFGPVPQTMREASSDATVLGTVVPKGTRVIISPWGTNRDEKLWGDDAGEFNPERWLAKQDGKASNNGGAESNYAMLTFLHGPRSCIGQSFAKAEFACLLAGWIGRFEFDLADASMADEASLDIKGGITAKPKGGMPIVAKVVGGW